MIGVAHLCFMTALLQYLQDIYLLLSIFIVVLNLKLKRLSLFILSLGKFTHLQLLQLVLILKYSTVTVKTIDNTETNSSYSSCVNTWQ